MQTRLLQFLSASLLFGAFSVAALPVPSTSAAQHTLKQATPARTLDLKFIDTTAAMRLRGGGESHGSGSGSGPGAAAAAAAAGSSPAAAAAAAAASAAVAAAAPKIIEEVAKAAGTSTLAGDQHRHAVLAQRMGLGDHAFVLPLLYSLLAGLSTGIGGLLCLLLQGNPSLEVPVTAFMLAAAASAMITVSMCDLFMDIAKEIGLNHTLMMSITGALTVVLLKKIGNALFGSSAPKGERTEETEKKKSELRLLRVGLLTAVSLTAHNLPEGMAVAISTMGSVNLGLKLAVAIALHNIPEGLAIACPLIMSKRYTPAQAIGIAFASGLSEPIGALLTLLALQNVITQERIDYALAFVGGVMMAVASLELMPEALRLQRHLVTLGGFVTGCAVMGTSLYLLE